MNKNKLTGIVLAGGKSRRMGVNKALIDIKGRKLIEFPVQILEQFCSAIMISSNQPLPLPYPVFADVFEDRGPMAGVYSCLMQSKTPYNIVLSCDMPFMDNKLIGYLIEKINGDKIIVPIHDDGLMEPLCSIYPTHCTGSLLDSISMDKLTLHEYIRSQPHLEVMINDSLKFRTGQLFANINTPEDLEKFKHN